MTVENIILVLGGSLSGLLGGAFYIFSIAIAPAFRSLKPQEHIAAMQEINRKILNPLFMLSFLGPSVLLPVAAVQHWSAPQFPLLAAAALLHIIGVNGVTVARHVPLNMALDKVNVDRLSDGEAESIRQDFQGVGSAWMRFHHLRVLASIAATALVLMACLSKNSSQ